MRLQCLLQYHTQADQHTVTETTHVDSSESTTTAPVPLNATQTSSDNVTYTVEEDKAINGTTEEPTATSKAIWSLEHTTTTLANFTETTYLPIESSPTATQESTTTSGVSTTTTMQEISETTTTSGDQTSTTTLPTSHFSSYVTLSTTESTHSPTDVTTTKELPAKALQHFRKQRQKL
ncbi:hypothetical protein OSTOST_14962 [Ostertagia ostertagi]